MPTINLAPLMWDIFMPIFLMIIAPTVILIIVFSVIKLSIGNGIRSRKTKKAIWRWITLIFLVVFAIIGLPATIAILKSINFEGYVTPKETISYISIPKTSSFSAEEYLAPFFEAFEKGQAKSEEAEKSKKNSESSSESNTLKGEDYEEFQKWAEEYWKKEHPNQTRSEEEYQEFLKMAEELWNKAHN